MKLLTLFTLAAWLSSCASTTIYGPDGRPVFMTQADMTKTEFARASDGAMRWTADTVNHSAATAAGGIAYRDGITATGAAIAATRIPAVVK